MPPAHELTAAPSPRVPALSVPRVVVRHRVAIAVLALTALSFLMPIGAHLRPVGLDHLGPRDPASGPLDRQRAVVEAAARAADDAVRALRRSGAGPVAVRRPRRGDRGRRDGLPRRPAPRRRCRRAPPRRRPMRSRPGRCATPPSATPRGCWSRSRWPRSTATSPAARATPSSSASARRFCAPRHGRSSASTACGCCGASPRARKLVIAGFVALPAAVAAARAVGLGRPAARGAPRPDAARQQRRLRRQPGRRGRAPVHRHAHPGHLGRARRAASSWRCCGAARPGASGAPPSGWRSAARCGSSRSRS